MSLTVVKESVGDIEEVHFVLFGSPAFNAYVEHVSYCQTHTHTV